MSQLDPSIILGAKSLALDNPLTAYVQAMQAQGMQGQNALAGIHMQQAQQEMADQGVMRNALSGLPVGAGADQRIAALYGTGTPAGVKAAGAMEAQGADIASKQAHTGLATAQTDTAKQKLHTDAVASHRDALANIDMSNPEAMRAGYAAWVDAGFSDPLLRDTFAKGGTKEQVLANIPTDPAALTQKISMSALGAIKYLTTQTQTADNAANNARMTAEGAANRGVTMRGQNMTDARTREGTAVTMSKPFEVTGPDGTPTLVQQDKAGNIAPVKGYGPKTTADKPLNDAQSKAALFGARMESANKVLDTLATTGTTTSLPGARTGFGVGAVVGALSSDKQQQLDQAKRDFVNAVLRRESGAVISPSEFDNAEKQYFPQIGDKAGVVAQKAENRATAIRGVQAEVPKASRGVIAEIQGGAPATPANIQNLLDKYK